MGLMMPPTSDRVELATSESANQRIYEATVNRLSEILQSSSDERSTLINNRLDELNNEWDMERLLEFNASTLLILTILLSFFRSSYWLILTLAIAAFLWQHAVKGWCPPIPVLRNIFGKRTSAEIFSEKVALKILRGDYQSINTFIFEQQSATNIESNAQRLLDLADLHCHNDNKNK